MEEFNKDGFPIIKLKDDCFEIKAVDYWEYRTFKYAEIVNINYYNDASKWWFWPILSTLTANYDPFKLKIIKENGADWIYNTQPKYNKEFNSIIQELIKRCGIKTNK